MLFTPEKRDLHWLIHKPIAHRGLHNENLGIVENSESAFTAALKNGFSIELDIQMTKDGEAIVFHDDEIDRILEGAGKVKDYTARQLKEMKFREGKDRIQTLAEMLEQINGRETVVVEIKSLWDGDLTLTNRAISILSSYKGPFAIMSFDPDMIAHLAATAEAITRGITADRVNDPYYDPLSQAKRDSMREMDHVFETRPHFVSFDFRQLPFPPITKLKSTGLSIVSWTIRNEDEAKNALNNSDQITFENFIPQ